MNTLPPEPSAKDKISATFIKALMRYIRANTIINGNGYKTNRGPNGTKLYIEQKRDRKAAAALHPWKVFAFAQSEDVDHCFEIHVPEAMVHVGEDEIEVEGLTAVEDKTDRYTLDCEDEIDESTVIHLAIVRQTSQSSWLATVIATLDDLEDYDEVLAVLPLAMLTVDSSGESPVGKVDAQYAHSSVTFSEGGASSAVPAPFDIEVTETEDPTTHEKTKTTKVVRCKFVWDGVEQELSDYTVPDDAEAVYLVCTQDEPTNNEPEWEFEMSDEQGEAPTGGRVVNYKLYDIEDGEATCDYRHTFLEINSPHKVSRFVVSRPSASDNPYGYPSIDIDASEPDKLRIKLAQDESYGNGIELKTTENGASAEIEGPAGSSSQIIQNAAPTEASVRVIAASGGGIELKSTSASSRSAELNTAHLTRGNARFNQLTVNHSNGATSVFDVVSSSPITITEGSGITANSTFDVITQLGYDTANGYIRVKRRTFTVNNGVVVSVGTESEWVNVISTQAHDTRGS